MSKNVQFIDELCELMGGDRFFLCDQYDQDDLFEMQDSIAKLIANNANEGLGLAKFMVGKFPSTFKTETTDV
jgi:hypothetical protein|tara:strand:+ start:1403 stop:1618 length:216 start_codon:yes stop_codon:yes gene_type:complete